MRGLSTLSLAWLELKRFLRGRLTTAAVVVLAVIPLLYGALYLYAFWDPYGHLNHIPAALVMDDKPAKASDGTTLHAGQDLEKELIQRQVFDWHVVSDADAQKGVEDGKYQILFKIPADFSSNLATPPDQNRDPQAGELQAVSNDATNYLSGVFGRTAFDEIRAAAAASASSQYVDKMLIGFTDLKTQTEKAAAGAQKIDDAAKQLETGADKEAAGLDQAHGAASTIANGLGTAGSGANDLVNGLAQLNTGAEQLVTGTAQAAAGGRQLAGVVDQAADTLVPVLRQNATAIQNAANLVARGADTLAANINAIDTAANKAVTDAKKLQTYVDGLPAGTPGLAEAKATAARLVTAAEDVQKTVKNADLDALKAKLRTVASTAREIAAAAPHLAGEVQAGRDKVDQLANGLDDLATGAKQLHTGTEQAESGAIDLRGGIYQLASGQRQLVGGLSTLAGGGHQIADGLGQLQNGAGQLASSLADGAKQIPSYGDDPSSRANVVADPVSLDRTVKNPAGTYGVGFAPYFLSLALWVGAMITFMVLKPLNRRYLMSDAPTPRVMLAGLLPAVAIGLVQASLLYVVVRFALGLTSVHPWLTWGLLCLTATVFAAIMQLLNAALGAAGRIVALALLMLQLTSSGGTYPVETTPTFFQIIHPLLPMTYTVEAMRHTIDGGPYGTVVHGVLLLLAYGIGALAITLGVTRRSRRMTGADLHPELVI